MLLNVRVSSVLALLSALSGIAAKRSTLSKTVLDIKPKLHPSVIFNVGTRGLQRAALAGECLNGVFWGDLLLAIPCGLTAGLVD
jgi:hypothetical protein